MDLSWMAWTTPTAIFFLVILALIVAMCVWEAFAPGGGPRVGILRFETTRGDRLFLSLLGAAFIHHRPGSPSSAGRSSGGRSASRSRTRSWCSCSSERPFTSRCPHT